MRSFTRGKRGFRMTVLVCGDMSDRFRGGFITEVTEIGSARAQRKKERKEKRERREEKGLPQRAQRRTEVTESVGWKSGGRVEGSGRFITEGTEAEQRGH